MYIYSDVRANLVYVETEEQWQTLTVTDADGKKVECPVLYVRKSENGYKAALDAAALDVWSLERPTLYWMDTGKERVRFGHMSLGTFQAEKVLLNEKPVYLRGYIRVTTRI